MSKVKITKKNMTIDDVKKDSEQIRLSVVEREYMLSLIDLAYRIGRAEGFEESIDIFNPKKQEN